eukprot:2750806-Pleurochrysis_carterae.AAC.3
MASKKADVRFTRGGGRRSSGFSVRTLSASVVRRLEFDCSLRKDSRREPTLRDGRGGAEVCFTLKESKLHAWAPATRWCHPSTLRSQPAAGAVALAALLCAAQERLLI